ncbi:MAG: nuclear transport factor 2 family protein, partial [Mesorhizobium sp.]
MLYSYIVEKSIRQSFDHVNNHRWDEAVKALVP